MQLNVSSFSMTNLTTKFDGGSFRRGENLCPQNRILATAPAERNLTVLTELFSNVQFGGVC